jgi:hypothetical protein
MSMPSGNIEWSKITEQDIVTEHSNHFQVNGTHVVYWGSIDALKVQKWLKERAKKDKNRPTYSESMAATIEGVNIDGSSITDFNDDMTIEDNGQEN